MITIPEVVETIVLKSSFLEEAIANNLINLSSLARSISSQIEEMTLKRPSQGAVVMALKRLSKKIQSRKTVKNIFGKSIEMIVRSNLSEYIITNPESILLNKKLINGLKIDRKYFFTLTEGVFETAIIVSRDFSNYIESAFNQGEISYKRENLSAITIRLPESNVITPGVYYYILKALAWEEINVIDVVSTRSEFTIIFDDKDIDRAFTVLKKTVN